MALIYDELGNVIGDDSTPDTTSSTSSSTSSSTPTVAQMKAALQSNQMPMNPNGSDVPLAIGSPAYKAAQMAAAQKANLSSSWDDNTPLPTSSPASTTDLIKAGIQKLPGAGLGSAAATMLSGQAGQVVGTPIGIMKAMLSGNYGTQQGVQQAQDTAEQIANAMTIAPTAQGQALLEGAQELANKATGSDMPIISPGMVHESFKFDPNTGKVLGAATKMYSRELRDVPTDFANAQSGVRKMNAVGDYTIGTRLQAAADDLAEYNARRQARRGDESSVSVMGISPRDIEDYIAPKRMYAVRNTNEGMPIKAESIPGGATPMDMFDAPDINRVINQTKLIRKEDSVEPIDKYNQYKALYVVPGEHAGHEAIDEAWNNFFKQKIKDLYPDAPNEQAALRAFDSSGSGRQKAPKMLEWMDQFAKDPRIQELARVSGLKPLPSVAEFEKRVQATNDWSDKTFSKHITRNVGTADDPFINLAKSGITFKPRENIMERGGRPQSAYWPDDGLMRLREKQGKHPMGETFPALEAKGNEVRALEQELSDMTNHKTDLGRQIYAEFPDRDPAENPEYAALTNRVNAKANEVERHKEQLENLKLANAYENINDAAIKPTTVGEFLSNTPYQQRQFFPQLTATKKELMPFSHVPIDTGEPFVPKNAPAYETNRSALLATGLGDAGRSFNTDVLLGNIPVEQIPNMSFPKYVTNVHGKRLEAERAAAKERAAKSKAFNDYAKSLIDETTPKIGNSAVFEFKRGMTPEQVRRGLAMDTEVLDHCVASGGGAGDNDKHFLTGDRRSHTPVVDPLTGEVPTRSSGRIGAGYDEDIPRGSKQVTSFRDLETGYPYATIEFKNNGRSNATNPKFDLGYVSGYKNREIDPKFRKDIQEYLNSRADEIESPNSNLSENAGIFDRTRPAIVERLLERAGVPAIERRQVAAGLADMPRFVTVEDVQALRNGTYRPAESADIAPSPTAAPATQSFIDQHRALRQEINDLEAQHRLLQENDPTNHEGHEALRHELSDRVGALSRLIRESNLQNQLRHIQIEAQRELSAEDAQYLHRLLVDIEHDTPLMQNPEGFINHLRAEARSTDLLAMDFALNAIASELEQRINAPVGGAAPAMPARDVNPVVIRNAVESMTRTYPERATLGAVIRAIDAGDTNLIPGTIRNLPGENARNAYTAELRNQLYQHWSQLAPTETRIQGQASPARVTARQTAGRNAMSGAPERRANLASATNGPITEEELSAIANRRPIPAVQHASGEVQRTYTDLVGSRHRRTNPQEELDRLNQHLSRMQNVSPETYNLRSSVGLRNLQELTRRHRDVLREHMNNTEAPNTAPEPANLTDAFSVQLQNAIHAHGNAHTGANNAITNAASNVLRLGINTPRALEYLQEIRRETAAQADRDQAIRNYGIDGSPASMTQLHNMATYLQRFVLQNQAPE